MAVNTGTAKTREATLGRHGQGIPNQGAGFASAAAAARTNASAGGFSKLSGMFGRCTIMT